MGNGNNSYQTRSTTTTLDFYWGPTGKIYQKRAKGRRKWWDCWHLMVMTIVRTKKRRRGEGATEQGVPDGGGGQQQQQYVKRCEACACRYVQAACVVLVE